MTSKLRTDSAVLVVDDNAVNRRITTVLLETKGYRVLQACDGIEALEVVEQDRVAVILLDLQMPRLDGHQTSRALREMEAADGVRRFTIVGLTAGTLSGTDESDFLEAGADQVLFKPLAPDELLAVVSASLEPAPCLPSEPSEYDDARRAFFGLDAEA